MTTQTLLLLLALTTGAGLAIFIGAWLGALSMTSGSALSPLLHHVILSFGGGALISAVGLVLVPDGLELVPVWVAAGLFLVGGLLLLWVDRTLHASDTPLSQVVATLLDFVPEAIVLGAVISAEPTMAIALAVIIAAQNLPEGYAAYCEIRERDGDGLVSRHPLILLAGVVVMGPLSGLFGYYVCGRDDPSLGAIMLVCAGGILFIVFRDIAPKANLERSGWPALGAVAGFTVGLVGLGVVH